jgi:fructose-bisphosphate aldolase class II
MKLKDYIIKASNDKVAIGHFNVSNIEMIWAVFHSAKALNVPIIIGISEGERDFIGVNQAVSIIKSIREQYNYPIFLNADHTYSFDKVKEAIDAGFDSVIFDGAKLSLQDNIAITKKCVEYARNSQNKDILIEAELGYIGQSSKILDDIPEGVDLDQGLTSPQSAKDFIDQTNVDLFAPAVGNIHGMMRQGFDPALNIDLIKSIKDNTGVPLVLHGGSGNTEDDLKKAIKSGISIVHVSTELRVAYQQGLKKSLQDNPEEVAPYKYLKVPMQEVEKVVTKKLKIFNNL